MHVSKELEKSKEPEKTEVAIKCAGGCGFYGRAGINNGMCSQCFHKRGE